MPHPESSSSIAIPQAAGAWPSPMAHLQAPNAVAPGAGNWGAEMARLQQANRELVAKLDAEGALRNTIQYEAQKLFPEMSRLHDENRNLYARLTDSEAQLTEAQTYSSKGWDLWGKVCAEKLDLQKDLDGERDKREMRARQDKKDGLQAGVHHKNIQASIARINAEKAAAHTATEMAQGAEAAMKSALDRKAREAEELETTSLRLMNQIELLESQRALLLDERNGAMADSQKLEAALSACEIERDTAKEWYESTLRANADKAPSIVQGDTATTVNRGPDMTIKPWRPAPHEKKFFGESRMFPDTASPCTGSSSSSTAAAPTSSSTATAPTPTPATDIELHHRAVRANPLEYGGSGVERQREIEKDYKMLVAARDKGLKDNNTHSGGGQERSGTVQGSSIMPAAFMATPANTAVGSSRPVEWRRQLERDTTQNGVATPSEWPPQEWGEERRAASARAGPDREPEPPVQGTPVKILVSGLDTLKVGKKSRKKGTPSKSKRKVKRSASPAAKRVGSSDAIMENAEAAASTEGKEEAGL